VTADEMAKVQLRKWRELENRTEAKARVRFFFSRAQQIKY
jgi:hypothetical protein